MAKTERSGHTTTDHDFIQRWVEERGGWPARVAGTEGKNDAGLIRIDFPGYSGEGSLERIQWDEWFQGFESNELAFLHRDLDHGGGDLDRFNKLISRGDDDDDGAGDGKRSTRSGSSRSSKSSKSAKSAKSAGKTASSGGSARKPAGGSARKTSSAAADTRAKASGKANGRGGNPDGAGSPEMRGLLLHDLGDLLSAERQFLVTTRALAREAQDPDVRSRAEEHVTETERQIQRLNDAFAALGERPRAVRCEAAAGLKEEHDSYKKEEKPSRLLLSAFGLGSGLRVEHYEIAAYRSAIAVAGALGEKECAQLLNESLREEMAMASFLEKTSKALLRRMAADERASDGGASAGAKGKSGSSAAKRASSAGKSGSSAGKRASSSGKSGVSAAKGASSSGKSGSSAGKRASSSRKSGSSASKRSGARGGARA